MAWIDRVRNIAAQAEAQRDRQTATRTIDPWEVELAPLAGEPCGATERVTTQAAFDHLGLRRKDRDPGAARRLSRAMRQLGWENTRWRPQAGTYQRLRGFVRAYRTT